MTGTPFLRWSACVALAAVMAAALPARADQADALLARGYRQMDKGKFEEALSLFEQAYKVAPTPKTEVQMGLAESALGRWAAAEDHLSEALKQDDPWIKKNEPAIREALVAVQAHIARVAVEGPAGASVSINGQARGALPLTAPIRCPTGPTTVKVAAKGHVPFSQTFQAEEGKTETVVAKLEALPPPPAPAPPPQQVVLAPQPATMDDTNAWIYGGAALVTAGAVALGIGGYLIGQDGKPDCELPNATVCSVHNGEVPGWILLSTGATAVVSGTLLMAFAPLPAPVPGARQAWVQISPASVGVGGVF